jgi:hypothetical protein
MSKILCFFKRPDGSVEYELLDFHSVRKYKMPVPDPKDPSRTRMQTFEEGFVFSNKHGVQRIDTGLLKTASTKMAAQIMHTLDMKDRLAEIAKPEDIKLLEEINEASHKDQ